MSDDLPWHLAADQKLDWLIERNRTVSKQIEDLSAKVDAIHAVAMDVAAKHKTAVADQADHQADLAKVPAIAAKLDEASQALTAAAVPQPAPATTA